MEHGSAGVIRAVAVGVRLGVELLPAAFVRAARHRAEAVGSGVVEVWGVSTCTTTCAMSLWRGGLRRRQHFWAGDFQKPRERACLLHGFGVIATRNVNVALIPPGVAVGERVEVSGG